MNDVEPFYSNAQQSIIDGDFQSVLVTAPAGAGKTRLLIGRAVALVKSGIPADRICCLTFTQKSAQEMHHRLCDALGAIGADIVCATFHGFALNCLRADSGPFDLGEDFRIISAHEAVSLLQSTALVVESDWRLSLKEAQKLYQNLSRSINRNEALFPKTGGSDEAESQKLETLYGLFVEEKLRRKLMDFDDLIFMFSMLLENNDAYRQRWSERFIHLLVDEYQDINDIQARLIALLSTHHGNVFAIGDHAQAIYGFRGANITHFGSFSSQYESAEIRQLTTNFRSTANIVKAAELMLKGDDMFREREVVSSREDGEQVALVGSPNKNTEAVFIATEAARLIQMGMPANQMCILVRLKKQATALQEAFERFHLPLELRFGSRMTDLPHVQQALGLIQLSLNASDADALWSVLRQTRGITPDMAERYRSQESLHALLKGCDDGARALEWVFEKVIDPIISTPPSPDLLRHSWCAQQGIQPSSSLGRVGRDLDYLGQLWSQEPSYSAIYNEVAMRSEPETAEGSVQTSVTLMSIHQSKGLEWDTVWVPGLNEGTLPIFGAWNDTDTMAEERRLLYVACTRAREQLYLCCHASSTAEFSHFGGQQSRFLRQAFDQGPHLFNGVWVDE